MFASLQTQSVIQSRGGDWWADEKPFERLLREQQEIDVSRAIDAAVSSPYHRMIMKLTALDGWFTVHIADCAGVPEENISQVIHQHGPRVLAALKTVSP